MSLINQMLRDLEARRQPAAASGPDAIARGVYAPAAHQRDRRPLLVFGFAGLGVIAAVAILALRVPSQGPTSAPSIVPTAPIIQPTVAANTAVERVPPPSTIPQLPVFTPTAIDRSALAAEPVALADSERANALPNAMPADPKPVVAEIPPVATVVMEKKIHVQTPAEQAEGRYRQAALLYERGRGDAAEREARAALGLDSAHLAARELAVAVVLQRGRWREAVELLEDGIAVAPGHEPFVRLLARIWIERGEEAKALTLLETSVAHAANAEYDVLRAPLYQRAGRHTDAIASYRRTLDAHPRDARAWLGLAISLEQDHQKSAATEAYQRALEANLDAQLAAYARGRIAAIK